MKKSTVVIIQYAGQFRVIGPFDRIRAQLWVDKYTPGSSLHEVEDPRVVEREKKRE